MNKPVEDTRISKIEEYIEKLQTKAIARISVAQIAEAFCFEADYLSKMYKQARAITIKDLLKFEKMRRAVAMLKSEKDLKIADIASRLGYNDPTYFSQSFKSVFKISPKEFRKNGF